MSNYSNNIILDTLIKFCNTVDNNLFITSEANLQLELAIYLRKELPQHKILLEQNIGHIFKKSELLDKTLFSKKEMDIFIEDIQGNHFCIELKFPPGKSIKKREQLFKKDIKFLEELVEYADFKGGYFFLVAWHKEYFNSEYINYETMGFESIKANRFKIQDIIWKGKVRKDREFHYLILDILERDTSKDLGMV